MQTKLAPSAKSKTKSTAAKGTSQAIGEQTAAFLKAGGRIIKIRSGTRDQEANTAQEQIK